MRGRHTGQAPAAPPGPAAPEERPEPPARRGAGAPGLRRRRRPATRAPVRSQRRQGELTAIPPIPRQARSPATGPRLPPLRRESHCLPPSPTLQDGGHINSCEPSSPSALPANHTAPVAPSSSASAFLLGSVRSSASYWQFGRCQSLSYATATGSNGDGGGLSGSFWPVNTWGGCISLPTFPT